MTCLLPTEELSVPSSSFQDEELVFGGPFFDKAPELESNKAFPALFICVASKADLLELVSDITTTDCIASVRQLTSRRGCPKTLSSDNSTKIIGLQSELGRLQKILNAKQQHSLQAAAAGLLFEWNFILLHAPRFDSLREAGIKTQTII